MVSPSLCAASVGALTFAGALHVRFHPLLPPFVAAICVSLFYDNIAKVAMIHRKERFNQIWLQVKYENNNFLKKILLIF
jgi:hypothetical protein